MNTPRRSIAERIYGSPSAPAAAGGATPGATSKIGERLYGGTEDARAIRSVTSHIFDRLADAARMRGRPDEAAALHQQREQAVQYFTARGLKAGDVQAIMGTFFEHQQRTPSETAKAQRWAGPFGFAKLIENHGGIATEAEKAVKRTDAFLSDLEKVSPQFARGLASSGAAQDPNFINAVSTYGAPEPGAAVPPAAGPGNT